MEWNGFYFTWPLRKQAACKQATRGPTALSPFRFLKYKNLGQGTVVFGSNFNNSLSAGSNFYPLL